ncbi:MAG: hypothetical protein ABJ059_00495 [Hyphomicrobiales bacterium]
MDAATKMFSAEFSLWVENLNNFEITRFYYQPHSAAGDTAPDTAVTAADIAAAVHVCRAVERHTCFT